MLNYRNFFLLFFVSITIFSFSSNLAFGQWKGGLPLDFKCDPLSSWPCGDCAEQCSSGDVFSGLCPSSTVYVNYQFTPKCLNLDGRCGIYGKASSNKCVIDENKADVSCIKSDTEQPKKTYGWTDSSLLSLCSCSDNYVGGITQWEYAKPKDTLCTTPTFSGTCDGVGRCIPTSECSDKSSSDCPTDKCCWGHTSTDSTEKCRNAGECTSPPSCGNGKIEVGEICELGDTKCEPPFFLTCSGCTGWNRQCTKDKCGVTGTCIGGGVLYTFDYEQCTCVKSCGSGQAFCPASNECLNCPWGRTSCTPNDWDCIRNEDCPASGRNGCYNGKYRTYSGYGTCDGCWCDYKSASYSETSCSKSLCGVQAEGQSDCDPLGKSFDSTSCSCVDCYNTQCSVTSIKCPSTAEAGKPFYINFTNKGTIAPKQFEIMSVTREGVESCEYSTDQTGCVLYNNKAMLTAPKKAGSYTYTANCYGAPAKDKKYCGYADDSKTCSINVVDTRGPTVSLGCPSCMIEGETNLVSWSADEEVSCYEAEYSECQYTDNCEASWKTWLSCENAPGSKTSAAFEGTTGKLYLIRIRAKDTNGNLGDYAMGYTKIAKAFEKKTVAFLGGETRNDLDVSVPQTLTINLPKSAIVTKFSPKLINNGNDPNNKPSNLALKTGDYILWYKPGLFGFEEKGTYGSDPQPYSFSDQSFSASGSYNEQQLKSTVNVNFTNFLQKAASSCPNPTTESVCTKTGQQCKRYGPCYSFWSSGPQCCKEYVPYCVESKSVNFCAIPINIISETGGKIMLSNLKIETSSSIVPITTAFSDGSSSKTIDGSPKGEIVNVKIPNENIISATMDVAGQPDSSSKSPIPALDIGSDGVLEWQYGAVSANLDMSKISDAYFSIWNSTAALTKPHVIVNGEKYDFSGADLPAGNKAYYSINKSLVSGANYIIPSDSVNWEIMDAKPKINMNLNGVLSAAKIKIQAVKSIEASLDPGHGYPYTCTSGCGGTYTIGSYISPAHSHKIVINGVEYTTSTTTSSDPAPCSKTCKYSDTGKTYPCESDPSGEHTHTVTINGKTYTLSTDGSHVHKYIAQVRRWVSPNADCKDPKNGCTESCRTVLSADGSYYPVTITDKIALGGGHSHMLNAVLSDPYVIIKGKKFTGNAEGDSVVIDIPNGLLADGINELVFGQENLMFAAPFKISVIGNLFKGTGGANVTAGELNNPMIKFKGSSLLSNEFKGKSAEDCSSGSEGGGCVKIGSKSYNYYLASENRQVYTWLAVENQPKTLTLADPSHKSVIENPYILLSDIYNCPESSGKIYINGNAVYDGRIYGDGYLQIKKLYLDSGIFKATDSLTIKADNSCGTIAAWLKYKIKLADTKNPNATVNSQTTGYTGTLPNGEEKAYALKGIGQGENILSFSTVMPNNLLSEQKVETAGGSGKFGYEIVGGINKTLELSNYINAYLYSCGSDPCAVPLTIYSQGSKIDIEGLKVEYTESSVCSIRKVYNVTVAGQLFYSNKTAASNIIIAASTDIYSAESKTDGNGYFHVVMQNVPSAIVEKNPKITIVGKAEVDVKYECVYDYTTEKCS